MPEEQVFNPPQKSILGSESSENISNEEFFKTMNSELNREATQTPEERGMLYDELKKKQEEFIWADKKDQEMIATDLVNKAKNTFHKEEFRKLVADTLSDQDSFGHNPTEKLAEYTNDIFNIVNGNKEPINKKGTLGYEMTDGWKSFDDIEQTINSRKLDQASRTGIKALVDDTMRTAQTIQPGEDPTFNYQKEYNNIKQKVINHGDIKSLATDKMFGDRVFKDDLQSAIKLGTYKDIGIPEGQIKDPTPNYGRITDEDAAQITSMILSDEEVLKDYLSEYFTKAMEQNWNNNLSPEIKRNKEVSKNTPQVKGGTIDKNGRYIRN